MGFGIHSQIRVKSLKVGSRPLKPKQEMDVVFKAEKREWAIVSKIEKQEMDVVFKAEKQSVWVLVFRVEKNRKWAWFPRQEKTGNG